VTALAADVDTSLTSLPLGRRPPRERCASSLPGSRSCVATLSRPLPLLRPTPARSDSSSALESGSLLLACAVHPPVRPPLPMVLAMVGA
jgi:hypothetical protein